MSRTGPSLPQNGPALGDVARLWMHLKKDWITDLEIRIEPGMNADATPFIKVRICSPGFDEETGEKRLITWTVRQFSGVDYKGSYNQLYDLLIVAFRKIEAALLGQERAP